jgi:hypothetical protein
MNVFERLIHLILLIDYCKKKCNKKEKILKNIITDENVINKIEETTTKHYKRLFNWVKLLNMELQLKEPEVNYDLFVEIG